MFGSAVSICVCERQIACWGNSNQRCENSDNYLFVWSLVQQWDDAPAHLHVQYLEWRFTGPELNVQTDTQWASALEKLALFYLTAVQMWTDGIIVATIWLWDWSPLLKHTELSKKNDEDCKAKRDSVHSLVKQGWKQTKSCMAKCYIHNNSLIHCLYKNCHLSRVRPANCSMKKATVLRIWPNFTLWCVALSWARQSWSS